MNLHPVFKIYYQANEKIISLLESVTLGTNGARYKHLDTRERIAESDNPLFLTMERNERVLGNITFLRRGDFWYIRYFAFDEIMQSGGKKKTKGEGLLKNNIEQFFQNAFEGEYGSGVESFYAYIDPANSKSLWMSENFGFHPVARVATQTFSRIKPRKILGIEQISDWSEVQEIMENQYSAYRFYSSVQTAKRPFWVARDEDGEIMALAKTTIANWQIVRLPGKYGAVTTRLVPFVPGLRKIIRPKKHRFVVPEAVFIKNNDPELFASFMESILANEKLNLALWWVDESDDLYQRVRNNVNWGILHKIVGLNVANVMVRNKKGSDLSESNNMPVFTSGFDFI